MKAGRPPLKRDHYTLEKDIKVLKHLRSSLARYQKDNVGGEAIQKIDALIEDLFFLQLVA